jgi:hypothetical protein
MPVVVPLGSLGFAAVLLVGSFGDDVRNPSSAEGELLPSRGMGVGLVREHPEGALAGASALPAASWASSSGTSWGGPDQPAGRGATATRHPDHVLRIRVGQPHPAGGHQELAAPHARHAGGFGL